MARSHKTMTLAMSGLAAVFNILSASLFRSLPNDPYHIARSFTAYQHFASIVGILGFIGALRDHSFSVAIFAAHFLLDTIIASIPRFAALFLLSSSDQYFCATDISPLTMQQSTHSLPSSPHRRQSGRSSSSKSSSEQKHYRPDEVGGSWTQADWSEAECVHVLWLLQALLVVGAVGITFLQFMAALQVKEHARRLMAREDAVKSGRLKDKVEMQGPYIDG